MSDLPLAQRIENLRADIRTQTRLGEALTLGTDVPDDLTIGEIAKFLAGESAALWDAVLLIADAVDGD